MTDAPRKVPIAGQIAEVKRELALRQNVYPGLVAKGKMRPSEAELCMRRMQAVLAKLMFCQEHEAAIRDYMRDKAEKSGGGHREP